MLKLHVTKGNSKMGKVASVSLLPFKFCYHCKGVCDASCYAQDSLWRENVRIAWTDNTVYCVADPDGFFQGVISWLESHKSFKLFRWHVSGDIPNTRYLQGMVDVAAAMPGVTFWAFTKNYEIVNEYLDNNVLPENLTIIFSNWQPAGFICDNPHNLPTSNVLQHASDFIPAPGQFLCGGDCENCMICRNLMEGQNVYFEIHGNSAKSDPLNK